MSIPFSRLGDPIYDGDPLMRAIQSIDDDHNPHWLLDPRTVKVMKMEIEEGVVVQFLSMDGEALTKEESIKLIHRLYSKMDELGITGKDIRRHQAENYKQLLEHRKIQHKARGNKVKVEKPPVQGIVYVFSLGGDLYKVGRTTLRRAEYRRLQIEDEYGIPISVHKIYHVNDVVSAEKSAHRALDQRRDSSGKRKELFCLNEQYFRVLEDAIRPFLVKENGNDSN